MKYMIQEYVLYNMIYNSGGSVATGDMDLIPGSGRSPPGGCCNPLQYSCLKNPMDRGAWWATVPGAPEESETT